MSFRIIQLFPYIPSSIVCLCCWASRNFLVLWLRLPFLCIHLLFIGHWRGERKKQTNKKEKHLNPKTAQLKYWKVWVSSPLQEKRKANPKQSKSNVHEMLVSGLETHFMLNRNPALETQISVPQSKDSYIKKPISTVEPGVKHQGPAMENCWLWNKTQLSLTSNSVKEGLQINLADW